MSFLTEMPGPKWKTGCSVSPALQSSADQHVPTTAAEPDSPARRAQLKSRGGSHSPPGETSLPGQQATGARTVQSNLHGDWIGNDNERSPYTTLPGSQDKASK